MKKVLILVVSSQLPPYDVMIETSRNTWDSVYVQDVETVFYCGHPIKEDTEKIIYFNVPEGYFNMGYKLLMAFEWALANKTFDYIARVNSSCYVDKRKLVEYVQELPNKDVFAGGVVAASNGNPAWMWGGLQYVISKDVINKIVDNKVLFDHKSMEDVAMSHLVTKIGVTYMSGRACSIDKAENEWRLTGYGSDSFIFNNFSDVVKARHHFYRVKYDQDRSVDKYLMENLFKVLN